MEVIKKKILLEKYISREKDSYGNLTVSNIKTQIYLTQTYEDIGMYSNAYFLPFNDNYRDRYKLLREDVEVPTTFNPMIDGRHPLIPLNEYNQKESTVTGSMDDRYLKSVGSYQIDENNDPKLEPGLNMSKNIKTTFNGVLSNKDGFVRYLIGGKSISGGNGYISGSGIIFNTNINNVISDLYTGRNWNETIFNHSNGGLRVTEQNGTPPNSGLYALYKQEEYLGVVEPPKVRDRVFINRGGEDIFERHSIMSEIKTRDDIDEYRNGYF